MKISSLFYKIEQIDISHTNGWKWNRRKNIKKQNKNVNVDKKGHMTEIIPYNIVMAIIYDKMLIRYTKTYQ